MHILKADTEVTVKIGPFVDKTDGNTQETGLTVNQASVRLSKNGGDFGQKDSATAASHDEFGWYDCNINGTDTNTEGRLTLACHISGSALPVWHEFMVVNANVFDSLYAAATTDYLQVDTIQVSGDASVADNLELMSDNNFNATDNTFKVDIGYIHEDATAAQNLEAMFDGTGYAGGTTKLGVDVTNISGDATAANNLEALFDNNWNATDNTLKVDIGYVNQNATAAGNLHDAFDGSTGYGFTGCTMPTTTSVTNEVTADVTKVSGDATAANRLEALSDNNWNATDNTIKVDIGYISQDATAADNLEAMFDGTGYAGGTTKLGVDVVRISGDATAATNLEAMFDGTGYTGGTAKLEVDVAKISGDATAPANLEAMYDGTGYVGGTTKLKVDVAEVDGDATARQYISRTYYLLNNKMIVADSTGDATLRNIGDSANLATGSITDDDTDTIRTEWSWV